MTRNSLESLEFEKRVKTLLTSLLATGKFKKKSSEGNLINITLHPRQTKKSEETWKISEKKFNQGLKNLNQFLVLPKKWIKKRDVKMDQTETLDYTDEYTAHLIGLELSFNLDR